MKPLENDESFYSKDLVHQDHLRWSFGAPLKLYIKVFLPMYLECNDEDALVLEGPSIDCILRDRYLKSLAHLSFPIL